MQKLPKAGNLMISKYFLAFLVSDFLSAINPTPKPLHKPRVPCLSVVPSFCKTTLWIKCSCLSQQQRPKTKCFKHVLYMYYQFINQSSYIWDNSFRFYLVVFIKVIQCSSLSFSACWQYCGDMAWGCPIFQHTKWEW